jgi:hypothetical protein
VEGNYMKKNKKDKKQLENNNKPAPFSNSRETLEDWKHSS